MKGPQAVTAALLVGGGPFLGTWFFLRAGKPEIAWRLAYDNAGRLTGVTGPGNRQAQYRYDLDARKRVRRVTAAFPGRAKVVSEFDAFERRVAMTDALGKVHYEYDGLGQLTQVRRDGTPSPYAPMLR